MMVVPPTRSDLEWSSALIGDSDSEHVQERMPLANTSARRFGNQRIIFVFLASVLVCAAIYARATWSQSMPLGGRPKSAMSLDLLEGNGEPDQMQNDTLDETSDAAKDDAGSNGSAAAPTETIDGDLEVDSNSSVAEDLTEPDSVNGTNESAVAQNVYSAEEQHPLDVALNESVAASDIESASSFNDTTLSDVLPEEVAGEVQDDAADRNLLLGNPASQPPKEERGLLRQGEDLKQAADKLQHDFDVATQHLKEAGVAPRASKESDGKGQSEADAGVTDSGCGADEDWFMALCYTSCASLTKDVYPHRMSPLSCCKVQDLACLTQPGKSITKWELYGATPHPPKWTPGLYLRQATR